MNKIFCMALLACSFAGFAQVSPCESKRVEETYCVVPNHGHPYIKHNGVKEDKDVKLANGMIIHSEGVIETRDRFIDMKPNTCIRLEDIIVMLEESEPIVRNK